MASGIPPKKNTPSFNSSFSSNIFSDKLSKLEKVFKKFKVKAPEKKNTTETILILGEELDGVLQKTSEINESMVLLEGKIDCLKKIGIKSFSNFEKTKNEQNLLKDLKRKFSKWEENIAEKVVEIKNLIKKVALIVWESFKKVFSCLCFCEEEKDPVASKDSHNQSHARRSSLVVFFNDEYQPRIKSMIDLAQAYKNKLYENREILEKLGIIEGRDARGFSLEFYLENLEIKITQLSIDFHNSCNLVKTAVLEGKPIDIEETMIDFSLWAASLNSISLELETHISRLSKWNFKL